MRSLALTATIGSLFAFSALANCSSSDSSVAAEPGEADAASVGTDAGRGDSAITGFDGGSDGASADAVAEASANADGASTDAQTAQDAGPPQAEMEPNDGLFDDAGVPETNSMALPGTMLGAIDPADDADLFTLQLAPGDLWEWELAGGQSSPYVPHLTVFDIAPSNLNPTQLVKAQSSLPVTLDHFVLHSGQFIAAVRDARNVPSATSQHVGAAADRYVLVAKKITPQPTALSLPQTVSGALSSVSAVAIYSFHAAKDTNVDIVLKAARKSTPSALNSRMSLFNATSKTAILTNDNAGASTDSEIHGPMPADADYWVIVENEADMIFDPAAIPDLSFDLTVSSQ